MYNTVYFNDFIYSHALTTDIKKDRFVSHCHSEYEILYIIKGTGSFVVENTSYKFSDSVVFLVPPGKYHILKHPPQSDYERIYIYLPENLLPPPVHISEATSYKISDEISELFFKMDRYVDTYSKEVLFTLFTSLINEILITLTYNAQSGTAQSDLPPIIRKAIEYISEHLSEPLTLTDIAKNIYVSSNHLSHIFSETMNISIMNYIRIKKMFFAKNFIQNGYTPTKAAVLAGYSDYPTFYKNYVSTFEHSPSKDYIKPKK